MKIIVLTKIVPDTYGDRVLHLDTGLADRGASDAVVDEISERALEAALAYADDHEGTEITVLCLAPADATVTIRKALAMGAGAAVHVVDDDLVGADALLTAETLAAAIRRAEFDLVIAGAASTDGAGGIVPAAIAEHLGAAYLGGMSQLSVDGGAISGERPVDGGVQQVSAPLPAVVSITEALADPRFPNFKGIMAAKKKPLEVIGIAELGIVPLRADAARNIMLTVAQKPARAAGVKIVDEGDAGARLAEYLIEQRIV